MIGVVACSVKGQTHMEKMTKEFSFAENKPGNTLLVANMNGAVKVTGYKGEKILIETEKTIRAKTNDALEKGKERISIGYKDLSDTIILYVDGLCSSFVKKRNDNRTGTGWDYDWCNCRDNGTGWREDQPYDYTINFNVKVPESANVVVSTINDGDVTVTGVLGSVVARNVNGSIKLDHLRGSTIAHTINGDVDLNYDSNPSGDCKFYTLNGNINADFNPRLSANLSFESFNGDFFTNVDNMELLPVTVEKADSNKGVLYKVKGNQYKIRNGGVHLDFETFNGNVYLKEKEGSN